MKFELAVAAVSMRSALKYRRNWDKNSPAVKALQSMMPHGQGKKGYRLYVPIGKPQKHTFTIPPAVRHALKKAGYVTTDYLAKKCVKIGDTEQKNVFNIGKVIAKDTLAKQAFDNDPQLQNSSSQLVQMVISCHPYDIIGMSTGRDWDKQSCMRLDDGVVNRGNPGQYNRHVAEDVAEGTFVVYAVRADDQNIQKPLCRCLVKPFLSDDGEEDILYRRETRIYGNPVPGFDRTLKQFIARLNEKAKTGAYTLNPKLYDDSGGENRHAYHTPSDPNEITFEDALDDLSQAEEFVRQLMEKVHKGEEQEKENPGSISEEGRGASIGIVSYLEQAHDLKKGQLKAIVELVKDSEFVKGEMQTSAITRDMSAGLGYVARKSGALHRLDGINHDYLRSDNAIKFARSGNVSAFKQLAFIAEPTEDDHLYDGAWAVNEILKGKIPIPSKEVLDEMPKLRDTLHTIASAARYMPLLGKNVYQEAAYEILDRIDKDGKKERGEHLIKLLAQTEHPELLLCYLMDNAVYTNADDWYEIQPAKAVYMLAGRRAFKAFDAIDDGKAQRFMADIKMEILKIIVTQPYQAVQFKNTFDAVKKWLEEDDDLVEAFSQELRGGWNLERMVAFVKFSPKSFMSLYSETTLFKSEVHVLLNQILPILLAYEGPKLEAANQDIEFVLQIAQAACKLLPHPKSLASKFEIEEMSNAKLSEIYEQRVTSKSRQGAFDNLPNCLSRIHVGDDSVDVTNDMPLLMSYVPASLFTLPQEILLQNHRLILKELAKLASLDDILTSLEYMADNLEPPPTLEEEDWINENMVEPQMDNDHPEFEEAYVDAREEARKKVEDLNVRLVDQGAKCLQATRQLLTFVGDPDDHDADDFSFGYLTPNIPEEDIEEHMSDIEEKQEYIKDKLNEYEEMHEGYKSDAGY